MYLSFSSLLPLVASLDWTKPIAVAVSGGGDSVALAHTIALYRSQKGHSNPVHFMTVDHQLRASSAKDSQFVQDLSDELGAHFNALSWQGDKPKTGVSDRARNARRELLVQRCVALDIKQLLLAHTMDDRLETLLMRVRRGGFRGHSSIPERSKIGAIILHRPFIMVSRMQLRVALSDAGLSWIEDPTNLDERYERVRIRSKLNDFGGTGIGHDQLARYALVMGRWRSIMGQEIANWVHHGVAVNPSNGTLTIKIDDEKGPIGRIGTEIIRELVRFIGGDTYLVSVTKAQVAAALLWRTDTHETLPRPKAFSVGRCVFHPVETSKLTSQCLSWELRRAERHLPCGVYDLSNAPGVCKWDGRFDISLPAKSNAAQNLESEQKLLFGIAGTTPEPYLDESRLRVSYRPEVLDGPINEHDWPIFDVLEGKIS